MTDLRGGETKRCSRQTWISLRDTDIGCDRGDGGERPDPRRAVRVPGDPDGVGRPGDIDQRSPRKPAAPAFGKIGTGGAEFGSFRESGHRCGCHAAALLFNAAIRRSGRIGISVIRIPIALRMALAIAGEDCTVSTPPMPTRPPTTRP